MDHDVNLVPWDYSRRKRMTIDHEAYHVAFQPDESGTVKARMEPNPDCPYCNHGWVEAAKGTNDMPNIIVGDQ